MPYKEPQGFFICHQLSTHVQINLYSTINFHNINSIKGYMVCTLKTSALAIYSISTPKRRPYLTFTLNNTINLSKSLAQDTKIFLEYGQKKKNQHLRLSMLKLENCRSLHVTISLKQTVSSKPFLIPQLPQNLQICYLGAYHNHKN